MAPTAQGTPLLCLLLLILSIHCIEALPAKVSGHRQSKAGSVFVNEDPNDQSAQPEPIHRSTVNFEPSSSTPNGDSPKQNVFFGDQLANENHNHVPMGATFENVPANYVGPNYLVNSALHRHLTADPSMASSNLTPSLAYPDAPSRQGSAQPNPLHAYYQGLFGQSALSKPTSSQKPASEDTINDVFNNAFKKYNVKQYLMRKIFGNTHDADEDENGFFSNKHLKRYGTAGVAAKVLGELIGIKIRESIEGLGKSVSEYAKDFTARNFVNLGQVFSRVLRLH